MSNVIDMLDWKEARALEVQQGWWKEYEVWRDWVKAENEMCRKCLEVIAVLEKTPVKPVLVLVPKDSA